MLSLGVAILDSALIGVDATLNTQPHCWHLGRCQCSWITLILFHHKYRFSLKISFFHWGGAHVPWWRVWRLVDSWWACPDLPSHGAGC